MASNELISGLRRILEDNVNWDMMSDVMLEMVHTKLHALFYQIKTGEIEEPPFTFEDMLLIHQILAKKMVHRGGIHMQPVDELDHTAEYNVMKVGMSEYKISERNEEELKEDYEILKTMYKESSQQDTLNLLHEIHMKLKSTSNESTTDKSEEMEDVTPFQTIADKYILVPIDKAYTLQKALEENINLEKGVEILKPRKILKSSQQHGKSLFYNTGKSLERMNEILFKVDEQYYVEQKFIGMPATIHKSPKTVKIYTGTRKEVTPDFKHIVNEVTELNDKSLIIVGSIVPIQMKKNTKVDPMMSKFMAWDIIYHNGKSLHDTQLYERRKILASLNLSRFTSINESPLMLVRDGKELAQAIAINSKLPMSNGALIKDVKSIYPLDISTDKWIEYRKAHIMALNVAGVSKTKNGFTYSLSIPVADKSVIEKEYLDGDQIILGNTYETQFEFDVGDKLMVAIEEVWKHRCKKDKDNKRYRYSIHKPRVLTNQPAPHTISHVELDELSEDI